MAKHPEGEGICELVAGLPGLDSPPGLNDGNPNRVRPGKVCEGMDGCVVFGETHAPQIERHCRLSHQPQMGIQQPLDQRHPGHVVAWMAQNEPIVLVPYQPCFQGPGRFPDIRQDHARGPVLSSFAAEALRRMAW